MFPQDDKDVNNKGNGPRIIRHHPVGTLNDGSVHEFEAHFDPKILLHLEGLVKVLARACTWTLTTLLGSIGAILGCRGYRRGAQSLDKDDTLRRIIFHRNFCCTVSFLYQPPIKTSGCNPSSLVDT